MSIIFSYLSSPCGCSTFRVPFSSSTDDAKPILQPGCPATFAPCFKCALAAQPNGLALRLGKSTQPGFYSNGVEPLAKQIHFAAVGSHTTLASNYRDRGIRIRQPERSLISQKKIMKSNNPARGQKGAKVVLAVMFWQVETWYQFSILFVDNAAMKFVLTEGSSDNAVVGYLAEIYFVHVKCCFQMFSRFQLDCRSFFSNVSDALSNQLLDVGCIGCSVGACRCLCCC